MIFKRIQTILALLLVGSVSMLAEGDDPFPEVNPHDFYGNMIMTAKVVLNGETLNDAIVAVYCDDEIRGKEKRPDEDNFFLLTVYGHSGKEQYLHFKVYTNGRIIEVNQGLKYAFNATYGSYAAPYIINLTTVTTNTSAEGWATTCLPFNAAVPDGVTVYAAKSIEDGVMKLDPISCTILPKNTPVLLKTETKTSYEWLSRVADGDATIETNLFKGTTEATEVEAKSVLTLGHATDGNKAIGFWLFNGTTIPANRAYLEKPAEGVRGYALDWTDEVTGIETIGMNGGCLNATPRTSDNRNVRGYDLLGRSLTGKSHLMIINGKKVMAK
jgi:hypothetical protein